MSATLHAVEDLDISSSVSWDALDCFNGQHLSEPRAAQARTTKQSRDASVEGFL